MADDTFGNGDPAPLPPTPVATIASPRPVAPPAVTIPTRPSVIAMLVGDAITAVLLVLLYGGWVSAWPVMLLAFGLAVIFLRLRERRASEIRSAYSAGRFAEIPTFFGHR